MKVLGPTLHHHEMTRTSGCASSALALRSLQLAMAMGLAAVGCGSSAIPRAASRKTAGRVRRAGRRAAGAAAPRATAGPTAGGTSGASGTTGTTGGSSGGSSGTSGSSGSSGSSSGTSDADSGASSSGSVGAGDDGGPASAATSTTNGNGCTPPAQYENLFITLLGQTQASSDAKLAAAWNQLYNPSNANTVFYNGPGTGEAYVEDIADMDVRTEGQSYGMMIALQLNHQTEFDRLWAFAKNHMYQAASGQYAWQTG